MNIHWHSFVGGWLWGGLFFILLMMVLPVNAQQSPPDTATLQRTISVLEQQRNSAMNAAAIAETHGLNFKSELDKAKARIKELEDSNDKNTAPAGK